MALTALVLPVVSALGAAVTGDAPWVVATAGSAGVSVSLSKFAVDAALQEHVGPRSRASAFARSETALQVAWVVGAAIAVVLPARAPAGFGLAAALPVLGLVLARQLAARAPAPG